jgi:hypothetical protein
MDKNVRSAIIGYWRSGATVEEIISITGLCYLEIMTVIEAINNN